jgi:hypothetical protein
MKTTPALNTQQGPKDSLEYRVFFKQGCEYGKAVTICSSVRVSGIGLG